MDIYPILVLLFSTILFFFSSCGAVDTLSANQSMKDGDTIVSDGEMFELGFFSPGKSKNRYLGVWYKKISPPTVVWVANRETPITDTSGILKVSKEGTLLILDGGNSNTTIWSSDLTVSIRNDQTPVAELLDSGNLVVWESSSKQNSIWQSFDYPGNTLMPGMKAGKNFITGREGFLSSWKSPDDPSVGRYKIWLDTNGYPQIFMGDGEVEQWRAGPWNGMKFRGLPTENMNTMYSLELVINEDEIYYRYKLVSSIVLRMILMHDGIEMQMNWIERTQEWLAYGKIVTDTCSHYGHCGSYGSCKIESPPCTCLPGFAPRSPVEWDEGDWSSGCRRQEELKCGTRDIFHKISGVKFPDARRSWYNASMSRGECEMVCTTNCSCTAYADLHVTNGGSGCLLWFDELMDIAESDDLQDLYIRIASSDQFRVKGQSSFNKKRRVLIVMVLVSSAALFLSAVAYAYRRKKKRTHKKEEGNMEHQMENVEELPFLSFHKITKATDNFNIGNKIGEGGFGPVYKGVLEDGQVIAVKRLSETSQQGLDEFQNEVICIAKLQHRNLVKLLGYCIHGNEKILIYEYMDNKSLDSFLFDEARSSMLGWPQRFHIIHGMARGILYLHQDSRLQIIHRDLKAGNILLDNDMNPKISDFGLARKFVGLDATDKTKKVVGTYGYISPEYAVHGRFSTKSDVFSFGVLVLEIVSGKKNKGFSHEAHADNLLGHAWRLYKEDNSIELVVSSLRESCVVSEVLRSIHVGLLCVQHHAEDRPTMLSVVLMLISEGALPPPKQPAFFTEESDRGVDTVSSQEEYMITRLYAR